MNIIKSISDPKLFRRFLADKDDSLKSWQSWNVALRCLYGLPIKPKYAELVLKCTGRRLESFKADGEGFQTALFICGRRSGKSRIISLVGAHTACLSGKEELMSHGEIPMISITSVTTKQARIVKSYLRSIFTLTPMLENILINDTKEGMDLSNGVRIEILVSDWRSVRGYSVLIAIIDEIAFMGIDPESRVKSDTELVNALLPSLATTKGRLLAITSPYAKRGWCWKQFRKHWGNENSSTLVWKCSSRTMNQTLPQKIVDDAMQADRASALAEWMGEFRDDIILFLSRDVVESIVVKGRQSLLPQPMKYRYTGFVDMSSGRQDDAAVCIGHKKENKVIMDFIKRYRPPFNPYEVIADISQQLKKYKLNRCTGDLYAAEFLVQGFRNHKISYLRSKLSKSQLYLELLPCIGSRSIEILDNEVLIKQLCNLERRVRSGGRDVVDAPSGMHDDVSNVCAGLAWACRSQRRVGAYFEEKTEPNLYCGERDTEITKVNVLAL